MGVRPSKIFVIEFAGKGDPFFGGDASDRILCKDGVFREAPAELDKAAFRTIEEARDAAVKALNRRENAVLGAIPVWEKEKVKEKRKGWDLEL
ncbi:hypothetical protein [Tepidimonas charontis]|uniref:hypothetical protein n=1 Tax=Tepidimonas charontis TaxID=2267262 RepID=UPI0011853782|nr:hypothetical protein [Tepidimonas charontis]